MSNDDSSIINWKSVFSQSETFVNNKPFKFCFIENFLNRDFFEKLYEVYPKIDESWDELNMIHKHQYNREWNPENINQSLRNWVKESEKFVLWHYSTGSKFNTKFW